MTEPTKLRITPRFSIRLLLALTALLAGYFACGPVTKDQGKRDIQALFTPGPFGPSGNVSFVAPMLLSSTATSYDNSNNTFTLVTKYYFWFFGTTISLPVQTEEHHDGMGYLMPLLMDAMKANEPAGI